MAYWNGRAYFAASDDYLRAYTIKNGQLTPAESSTMKIRGHRRHAVHLGRRQQERESCGLSSTKAWNGPDNKPAVLYAFDATKLGEPIYTSEQNSQRDRAAMATRFVIPVVVNGRVYFGARGEVEVYGLLK